MTCARCLEEEAAELGGSRIQWGRWLEPVLLVAGFLLLWGMVIGVGKLMSSIPAPVHDASIWEGMGGDP